MAKYSRFKSREDYEAWKNADGPERLEIERRLEREAKAAEKEARTAEKNAANEDRRRRELEAEQVRIRTQKAAEEARERAHEEQQRQIKERQLAVANVMLTTAPYLEGYRVLKTIDIVTAEAVAGMSVFSDFFSFLDDELGGRSRTQEKGFTKLRAWCLRMLRENAHDLGANAVIAVDLDYGEITGNGKSMLFLNGNGTAVAVRPLEPERTPSSEARVQDPE